MRLIYYKQSRKNQFTCLGRIIYHAKFMNKDEYELLDYQPQNIVFFCYIQNVLFTVTLMK